MSWISEHDESYAVPPEVLAIPGIRDHSWHNDTCPRFALTEEGDGPNLFVEHPDVDKREDGIGAPRFNVVILAADSQSSDDLHVHEGDDARAAVTAFMATAHAWLRRN
jgi:hypothetical protein